MKKVFIACLVYFCFISCQKKVDENVKTNNSFKNGTLSITCEKSSKSGACNYLIYNMNCEKPTIVEEKEEITCKFTKVAQFKLREKESRTLTNLLEKPEICMKTDIDPTLENCVKK